MERYESYKDSGVKWLGEIPGHWEVRRLKYSCILVNNKTVKKLPYIELDNIESKSGKLISYSSNDPDSICNAFEKGDILFCKLRPYLAKCIITEIEGKCSSELLVLRKFIGENKLLKYILLSHKLVEIINASTYGAKMPRASWTFIGNCIIPIPNIMEQKAIVDYLDSVTSKIDEAISQQQKMIDLLNERKQIIIQNAVTKGLDPNAKMKDSGVEWIGEIPEDWEVMKCSYVYSGIGSGTTPKSSNENYYSDEGINFLQTGDLNDGYIISTTKKITDKALRDTKLKTYSKESLIIAMYGATIGKLGVLKICTTVNQACCVLPKSQKMFAKYSFYMYMVARKDLIQQSRGGGQPNISQDTIRNQKIIVPPKNVQEQIVLYIDNFIIPINSSISQCEKMISLLQERKQIIINDVVTGKVKVC